MLSADFLQRCDPSYRDLIQRFQKELGVLYNSFVSNELYKIRTTDRKFVTEFPYNFLLPPTFWMIFRGMTLSMGYSLEKFHFHSSSDNKRYIILRDEITLRSQLSGINFLKYPHTGLQRCFHDWEMKQFSPFPKEVVENYQRMKSLYKKIKSVEHDDKLFLDALKEVGDDEFVEQNMEYRIGQNLTNKKLWKLYIAFLKDVDQMKMLETYSKYCRFFLDDHEMKEEYEKVGKESKMKVEIPWQNPLFEFEITIKMMDEVRGFISPSSERNLLKRKHSDHKKLQPKFDPINMKKPQFCFQSSVIHYIAKTADPNVLHKLFLTCKFFYAKYPALVCYKLVERHSDWHTPIPLSAFHKFVEQSSESQGEIKAPSYENTYISTVFSFQCRMKSCLSWNIPTINQCTAKYITITNQNLTKAEFSHLANPERVVLLSLHRVEITNNDGKILKVDEILEMVPKIQSFWEKDIPSPPNPFQKFLQIPFRRKFYSFVIQNIVSDGDESTNAATEFIKKNFADSGFASFKFHPSVNAAKIAKFKKGVYDSVNLHWPNTISKPLISII